MPRTRQPEVSNDVARLITQVRAMIGKGEELPPRAGVGRPIECQPASLASGAGNHAGSRGAAAARHSAQ